MGLGTILGVSFLLVLGTDLPGYRSAWGQTSSLFSVLSYEDAAWWFSKLGNLGHQGIPFLFLFLFLILPCQSMMVEFSSSELSSLKGEGYGDISPGDPREGGYGACEAEQRSLSPEGQPGVLCPGSSAHPAHRR